MAGRPLSHFLPEAVHFLCYALNRLALSANPLYIYGVILFQELGEVAPVRLLEYNRFDRGLWPFRTKRGMAWQFGAEIQTATDATAFL
jgi:hypothetical protein